MYTNEGLYGISTQITRVADGTQLKITGSATATDADKFSLHGAVTFNATAGVSYTGPVATFSDTYARTTTTDLAATVSWGDGASSAGTVSIVDGKIVVAGSHVYVQPGIAAVTDAPST